MFSRHAVRFCSSAIVLTLSASLLTAQTPRDPAPAKDPRTPAQRSAKGPLPDPAILDGSALEAEKRPENGMLGEFEMPGDENAEKSDRVGQTSAQPPPPGGGGSQQSPDPTKSGGGGGAPSASQSTDQAAQGGGASQSQGQQQGQQAGGKSSGSQSNGGAAEGQQVGELKSDGSGGDSGGNAPAAKPQQVALGDSAMQIKPQQQGGNAPPPVGAQQLPQGKDAPQQYDAKTPSGGKQSGSGKGNQGVEKGRVMPAGI